MKHNNIIIAVLVALVMGLLVGITLTNRPQTTVQPTQEKIRIERDTVVKYDTITQRVIEPKYLTKTITRVDTIKADTILNYERLTYSIPVKTDSVTGEISAVVSGHDATLDTITYKLNIPRRMITNTIEVERTIKKRSHFYYGIGIGAGYGLTTKQPDIFVGLSVGYAF